MIRLVLNRDIDRSKWDALIESKGHSRMYALSAYLDVVCKEWYALILKDYEAVMPLPLKRNWLNRPKYDLPLFAQQLGIIGTDINPNLVDSFIQHAKDVYAGFKHPFNHENGTIQVPNFESTERVNYELDLSKEYEEIKRGYNKNLSRNIKKVEALHLDFRVKSPFSLLKSFILDYSEKADPSPRKIKYIEGIYNINQADFDPTIYSVWVGETPLAVCMAPRFKDRITLLIPRSSPKGKDVNAMAYLIDQIIQNNAGTPCILDFEGSMLPGVARFYQSFGAENRPYSLVVEN